MHGIKIHSHRERERVAMQLKDFLVKKYGKNLLAFVAEGSFARNEDTDYSDLEFTVFLKKVPKGKDLTIRKIINGLLVVVIFETKESYIKKYLDFPETWYSSGEVHLLPIIDNSLVREIENYKIRGLKKKCINEIQRRWPFYQEVAAKVLNSLKSKNKELLAIAYPQMVKEILIIMSFLNTTPYKTLGSYISQSKKFKIKPTNFDRLVEILIKGKLEESEEVESVTRNVFESLERILVKKIIRLYSNKLA